MLAFRPLSHLSALARQRREQIERELATKVSRHTNPFRTLTINYGANRPGKVFNEEEDRFLVCTLSQLECVPRALFTAPLPLPPPWFVCRCCMHKCHRGNGGRAGAPCRRRVGTLHVRDGSVGCVAPS